MNLTFFMNLLFTLLATSALVFSAPISPRDVFVPQIMKPNSNTNWTAGQKYKVEWDVSNPPTHITNKVGRVVLVDHGLLQLDHPLAEGFDILDGCVLITAPNVPPGKYKVVVFGDSGNESPLFTIKAGYS